MRRRTRTHTIALALAVVALAALLPAEEAAAGLAPAFALELLDGKTLRLADYRGSPVILLFWAPW
jgi:cytochrome c biogenesis protein CcmG/thiol:disulfide interchange protein DsbE